MAIDPVKLRADADKARADRLKRRAANGRPQGVLMAQIRDALPEIESLRAATEPMAWNDIAQALSEQGLKTRSGAPLTGNRLTALVSEIRKQDAARAQKQAKPDRRVDAAPPSEPSAAAQPERRPKLSPKLARAKAERAGPDAAALETEIREAQYDRHSQFIKGNN